MLKGMPIGIHDFEELISQNFYYIDKSLFIKEFLESRAKATLIPRPRRFGKTLNMSMLKCFFEKTEKSRAHLFENLAIYKHKDIMAHQGKYPVIFITLKSADYNTWERCLLSLKNIISVLYRSHSYLLQDTFLDSTQKKEFESIVEMEADEIVYTWSILKLSEYLNMYHNKKSIVIIDEYDVPMNSGFRHEYYDDVALFVRSLLNNGLKDNPYLEHGVVTGALRIAKESIFTGFNNPSVSSMLTDRYSDKFGLLEEEVHDLLSYYGLKNNMNEIRSWYNGYQSGTFTVYNPWSIINFTHNGGELQRYWANTGSDDILKKLIKSDNYYIKEDIEKLLSNSTITKGISETTVYSDIEKSETTLWSFLLFTGYLTFKNKKLGYADDIIVDLQIPNKEVAYCFRSAVVSLFEEKGILTGFNRMIQSLLNGDTEKFNILFPEFVLSSFSFLDISGDQPEKFYHAFVLGMLASVSDAYEIKSNLETGLGRCDVMIIPRDNSKLPIILEFKKVKTGKETIEQTTDIALKQIKETKYATEIFSRGFKSLLALGIAFEGKDTLIQSEISARAQSFQF